MCKEGQPGEWRVIADMLRGGQNEFMGNDPVFLPMTAHILDQMYTGGYSAMVDASKFFYQFPITHPENRPYLGAPSPGHHGNLRVLGPSYYGGSQLTCFGGAIWLGVCSNVEGSVP